MSDDFLWNQAVLCTVFSDNFGEWMSRALKMIAWERFFAGSPAVEEICFLPSLCSTFRLRIML